MKIGETIDVLGRNVVLTDCDAFTKRYYFEKFGIEEFHPIERPKNIKSYQSITVEREIPPYNGWGSLADSEANCLSLMPKPPHRDMNKFLTLDRCNLRFQARMISSIPENGERNFIITYYLSDDTISVYEFAGRNSGFSVQNVDFLNLSFSQTLSTINLQMRNYFSEWRFFQTNQIQFARIECISAFLCGRHYPSDGIRF